MSKLHVTCVQSDLVWESPQQNLLHFQNILSNSYGKTDVVILPEMFSTGFTMNNSDLAEDMNGRTITWMKEQATKGGFCLCGSLIISDQGQMLNRLIWAHPDGKLDYYDKKHLFNLSFEGDHYTPGTKRVIVQYKGWNICPLVCYDLRFPEWARNDGSYDLLIYVANWPEKRSLHWSTLIKARAIENQTFTIGVNRVGIDGNNLVYSGDSCICSYDGTVIEEHSLVEKTFSAILSKDALMNFREKLPFLRDQSKIDYRH